MSYNFGETAKELEIIIEQLKQEMQEFNYETALLSILKEMALEQIENEDTNSTAR